MERLDGTFDVTYDDGYRQDHVDASCLRLLDKPKSSNLFFDGDIVEGNYRGKNRWHLGKISKIRVDGTYDVTYNDGEVERSLSSEFLRFPSKDHERLLSGKVSIIEGSKFQQGTKVACYWYSHTKFSTAKFCKKPKTAIVLRYNSDDTYTVEMMDDGMKYDDVKEIYLKTWIEGTRDIIEEDSKSQDESRDGKALDKWVAVFNMSQNYAKYKRSMHDIPAASSLLHQGFKSDLEKLEFILGKEVIHEFKISFQSKDKYDDNEIDINDAIEGFEDMGARISQSELRNWLRVNASRKTLKLPDYIIAYANLIFPSEFDFKGLLKQGESERLGRSLRLSIEGKDLSTFAHTFGKKLLKDLETAFDNHAVVHPTEKDPRILARDIIEAFLSMGRAITVSRLQEWMMEAGISAHDRLTLADFATVFAYFFQPSKEAIGHSRSILSGNTTFIRMTLAEIAVQVLQEEKWKGDQTQSTLFVRRLCVGRSDGMIEKINAIRTAFDEVDINGTGEVSVSQITDVFFKAHFTITGMLDMLEKFKIRLNQQARGRFLLPEIFESFGPYIEEISDGSITISEAISMFRMHCSTAEVRVAADLSGKIIDNLLANQTEPKYWQINIQGDEFRGKIWQYEAGKSLMRAIGFNDPFDAPAKDGSLRRIIGLKGLPLELSKVQKLPADIVNKLASKRIELDNEIISLEGAPSVAAAVREMRINHSIAEVRNGLETALSIVRNVLTQPKDLRMHRVKKGNPVFHRNLGRLTGSVLLMNAIGYADSSTHSQTNNDMIDESVISAYVLKSISAIVPHKLDKGLDIGFASTADLGTCTFHAAVHTVYYLIV
jgi:Ca2+-binding EF-hand superfamily protein